MLTVERFQELVLPYLYDLLEPEERREFEAYLDAAPDARSLLDEARARLPLLAEAAKESFPEVRFTPPVLVAPITPAPVRGKTSARPPALPLNVPRREPRPPIRWVRWALAASVLLAFVGGGGYWSVSGWARHKTQLAEARLKFEKANQDAARLQQELEQQTRKAQQDIRAIQEQINLLVDDWNRAAEDQRRVVNKKQLQVILQGPKNLQAGAKNQFDIELRRSKPMPPGAKLPLTARVVDAKTKQVLFKKELQGDRGKIQVDLPPDVPVTPGADLVLEVIALAADGAPVEVREHLTFQTPEYMTHLTTDRPMYRPGEVVRFRSLTVERFSLKPPREDLRLHFKITGPNQQVLMNMQGGSQLAPAPNADALKGPDGQPLRGIGAGQFTLPAHLPGGQYTLEVSESSGRFPPEKRVFFVHRWQAPRLNKELTFNRSSYGPNETMLITARASYVEGGAVGNVDVSYQILVDGRIEASGGGRTDVNGQVKIAHSLSMFQMGEGIVSLTFNDGANPETIVRPLPLATNRLLVEFFPEGGDLIAGVTNRVYFQARRPNGKPADLRGRVVEVKSGTAVAQVQTVSDEQTPAINQGSGVFEFVPQAGQVYELRLDSPVGMHPKGQTGYRLPQPKANGVILRLPQGVVENQVDVQVTSVGKERELLVGAYCRGKLLDHVTVQAKAGERTEVTLRPTVGVGGVYRITVFEKLPSQQFAPVAERLIFRKSPEKLLFQITAEKKTYYPGEKVRLSIESVNEKREFAPAVALVSVVDQSVLKLADEKTARTMPTHFLLTTEVKQPEDLEHADFFLSADPKAAQALDLLLGVQGWRRFAEQNPATLLNLPAKTRQNAVHIAPMLAAAGKQTSNADKELIAQVDDQYAPKFIDLQKKLAEAEKNEFGQPKLQLELQASQIEAQTAQGQISQSSYELEYFQRFLLRFLLGVLVVGSIVLGLVFLYWGMRRLSRGRSATALFVIGGGILCLVFMGSLAGTFFLMGSRQDHRFWMDPWDGPVPKAAVKMAPPMAMAEEKAWDKPLAMPEAALKADVGLPPPVEGRAEILPVDDLAAPANPLGAAPAAKFMPAPGQPMPPMGGAAAPEPMIFRDVQGGAPMFQFDNGEKRLRQLGNFKELLRRRLHREVAALAAVTPLVVREYAHQNVKQFAGQDVVRRDFSETLYWHPALVLTDGKGAVSFDLSDANTTFEVAVIAHTLDGRLGAGTFQITARLPASVEPKVPIEVTANDKIAIPVALKNDSGQNVMLRLMPQVKNLDLLVDPILPQTAETALSLEAGRKTRKIFTYKPKVQEGTASFRIRGDFGPLGTDVVERTFKIVPDGFPVTQAQSGVLEKSASLTVELPNGLVEGTLDCQVQFFPSTLAQLQKGLDALLREPCGCFEQSSSSNYPNVLILNYLKETDQANPALEQKARQLLQSGYGKLVSFECIDAQQQTKRQGYEWFGQTAPPHEALTAYGLLQFKDMARVHPVDPAMLERTQKYLLGQRDGKGGFKRNPRALDSFGRAPEAITNAYIVWALTETAVDPEELVIELKAVYENGKESKDPYLVALAALGQLNAGRTDEGLELCQRLKDFQKPDGAVPGGTTSITSSSGRTLDIETTALATLAWLKANRPEQFALHIDRAAKWLGQQRGGYGGFGATQSTILALKALIAHTQANKQKVEPGNILVFQGDNDTVLASHTINVSAVEPIALKVPSHALRPGKNKLRLQISNNNVLPYTVSWSYRTVQPLNPPVYPVHLIAQLSTKDAREGDTVRLTAVVENKSGKDQGMTVAILGLPGGLALPEDFGQLKELAALRDKGTKPGVIGSWELRGRELVLYWRSLAKDEKIEVNLDLICRLPGQYRGPACRAYLYYDADAKYWTNPLSLAIQPRND